ncbi:AsmA family protein [Pseudobacteriovorax antillogorgiicola]|uniref:AsmA family protein n=1 Tax=Pseudobacteriovorax antillogorgiicola TaxID=1513793 RepID=A0A1Y6BPT9_9BACT|nr:AsmA family protein [Pseudobacteriovorax antillogorgiicola]TCS53790.1 AsmA-like protein [Pseudobacteriovorax antillogorgiicola]SMF22213.1 AsmA family protein [Pseudobacteriovorax antillogorgiicola]
MLKKALIAVASVIALLLGFVIITPLVVDVNQYRPEIEQLIQKNINGSAKIGRLSLSLWGRLAIEIDELEVKDAKGKRVLAVQGSSINFPFISLISGAPELTLRLDGPEIYAIKESDGSFNLLSLAKEDSKASAASTSSTSEPEAAPTPAAEEAAAPQGLAPIIVASKVDLLIENAKVIFSDKGSGLEQKITDFNILLKDVSLGRPMDLDIWADLNTKLDTISLEGPFKMTGEINPVLKDQEVQGFEVKLESIMDKISISVPETFRKSDKVTTQLQIEAFGSPEKLTLKSLIIKFHDLVLEGRGEAILAPELSYSFNFSQNQINLKTWKEILPPLKDFVNEDMKLSWTADLVTDHLKTFKLNFKAPENDLTLVAGVENFSAPNINLNMKSTGLNIDRLLPPSKEEAEAAKAKPGSSSSAAGTGGNAVSGADGNAAQQSAAEQAASDVDAQLAELKNNEMLKQMKAQVGIRFDKVTAMNVDVQDFILKFTFNDLKAVIEPIKLKVFGGQINTFASLNLQGPRPIYKAKLTVDSIQFKDAVESQLPKFANTIMGNLSLSGNAKGESLNNDLMMKNLVMNGDFKILDASFATVDIVKMVNEGGAKAIQTIKEKFPKAPLGSIASLGSGEGKFKEVSSNFSLAQGVMKAPNFKALSFPGKGVDINGYTEIDLLGDKIQADWNVIDTYNKTGLKSVSLKEKGVEVKEILAEPGKPIRFPIKVGCKLSEPCYKYDAIPGHFWNIASKKIEKAAGDRLKAELKKRTAKEREKIKKKQKKVEEDLKKKAKDFLKGKKLPF